MTATDLTAVACETGKTGGWLLQAPAAFFRRFTRQPETLTTPPPATGTAMLTTQVWLVTSQSRNGDIQTNSVRISGIWRIADIATQARDALHLQHDMRDVQILRLSLDFNMTPARLDALRDITTKYKNRIQFEEECG